MAVWGDFILCLFTLSITPPPLLTFFLSSHFFTLSLSVFSPTLSLLHPRPPPRPFVSVFLGANHRALEGAAGEGGEREGRGDGVQQEGAEGVEGESFPAAGWPCWPRGRTHTHTRAQKHTHTHTHPYLQHKSENTLLHLSESLSRRRDWSITVEQTLESSRGPRSEGQQR